MTARATIHRFRTLTWAERRLLLQAAVLLPLVGAALRPMRLRRVLSLLDALAGSASGTAVGARRTAQVVGWAARYGATRGTCLTRSLTLWCLLRRQRIAADLRIGVRREGAFEAHAWIEHDGRVLNDTPDVRERYRLFAEVVAP